MVNLFVNRQFQRQGFATEALGALLGLCLGDLGLRRVSARCDSRNVAACRLLEKLGVRREGEFVQDHLAKGEWANTVWWALLAEEYHRKMG